MPFASQPLSHDDFFFIVASEVLGDVQNLQAQQSDATFLLFPLAQYDGPGRKTDSEMQFPNNLNMATV